MRVLPGHRVRTNSSQASACRSLDPRRVQPRSQRIMPSSASSRAVTSIQRPSSSGAELRNGCGDGWEGEDLAGLDLAGPDEAPELALQAAGDPVQRLPRNLVIVLGAEVLEDPVLDGSRLAEQDPGLDLVDDGGADRGGGLGIEWIGEIAAGADPGVGGVGTADRGRAIESEVP